MAVPAGPTEIRYVGNGVTTVFAVPFLVIQAADLAVYVDGVLLSSGYTQSGVGNPTSTVTFTLPPASLAQILFQLDVPFQRLNDYQENGDFLASTVNRDFDRIWQALKQLLRLSGRALTLGQFDVDGQGWYRAKQNGIRDLADPVDLQDAVNKRWVTLLLDSVSGVVNTTTGILYDAGTLFDYLRFGVSRTVDSIAALRLLSGARNQRAFVLGYFNKGDGGGGAYFADPTDTTTADNGGSVIVAADGVRWKLQFSGGLSVAQFGAVLSVTDHTSAFQNCANSVGYGGTIFVPRMSLGGVTQRYFLSQTVSLRGATKMIGDGVSSSVIHRTGDYGDTFVIGTKDDQSEPARDFMFKDLQMVHGTPFSSGGTSIDFKVTKGAHIRAYGGQEFTIEGCWLHRMRFQFYSHGGTWGKVINNQFLGVWDPDNAAIQESVAQVVSDYSALYGNPTTWVVTGNNFLGATIVRNITYHPSSGDQVVNRIDTIGPQYGMLIYGNEDFTINGNYFGGQSIAEIGVFNQSSGGVIDGRVHDNFFDGISRGSGVLLAPTVANAASLALDIYGNIFTDNLHGVYANRNSSSATPGAYKVLVHHNIFLSGIGCQVVATGLRGFSIDNNLVTDYNKHNLTSTDPFFCSGVHIAELSDYGSVHGNKVGSGANTVIPDVSANFCYAGITIDQSIVSVERYDNTYFGIREGATIRTGRSSNENIFKHTAAANYKMPKSLHTYIRAFAAASTVVLPSFPVKGKEVRIKEGVNGVSGVNTFSITTDDGALIDGSASISITSNLQVVGLAFDGVQWIRI